MFIRVNKQKLLFSLVLYFYDILITNKTIIIGGEFFMPKTKKKEVDYHTLAMPIAIVIAGVLIAGAVIYTNLSTTKTPSKYQAYLNIADTLKLNKKKLNACLEKFDDSEIKGDLADAQKYGANGTPTFFVGKSTNTGTISGVRISGAQPYEVFVENIEGFLTNDDQRVLGAQSPVVNTPSETGQPDAVKPSIQDISMQISVDNDPVLGKADAPVTMVEFSDYECPFCKRHFQDAHKRLVENYVNTGKLKIVFRDLPLSFHDPKATEEAVVANCAREQGGDDAYFKFHDAIFEATKSNGEGISI